MACKNCIVCGSIINRGLENWHFQCVSCGYEFSTLVPRINHKEAHGLLDEASRFSGLKELRIENFKQILSFLFNLKPSQSSLLEVGCAYGWFLELAKDYFKVLGIEPDRFVFESVESKYLPVRFGCFPLALELDEKFDVIIFNDVIEHIPNIEKTLQSCNHHLNLGGYLALNIPQSDGFFL